jgi:hypothetical protein
MAQHDEAKPATGGDQAARAARLAEKLRENLKRRKQQARQRCNAPAHSSEEAGRD